jgi:hypothetical protein
MVMISHGRGVAAVRLCPTLLRGDARYLAPQPCLTRTQASTGLTNKVIKAWSGKVQAGTKEVVDITQALLAKVGAGNAGQGGRWMLQGALSPPGAPPSLNRVGMYR